MGFDPSGILFGLKPEEIPPGLARLPPRFQFEKASFYILFPEKGSLLTGAFLALRKLAGLMFLEVLTSRF